MSSIVVPSESTIRKALSEFQIDANTDQVGQIQEYIRLLLVWNEKVNLTAIRDPLEILYRHFCESMFATKVVDLRTMSTRRHWNRRRVSGVSIEDITSRGAGRSSGVEHQEGHFFGGGCSRIRDYRGECIGESIRRAGRGNRTDRLSVGTSFGRV